MATLPSKLPSDNISCHRELIYLCALFIDTRTCTDHTHAHAPVQQIGVVSLGFAVLLQQHSSPPTSLHGKGHAGHMTRYLKRTWWIPKAGQAQSNYTPGRFATFVELCLNDILFLFGALVKIHLRVYGQHGSRINRCLTRFKLLLCWIVTARKDWLLLWF